jgi:membrane protein YdbS with pleckstrin-like domain
MLLFFALFDAVGAAVNWYFYDQSHHWYNLATVAICVVGGIYALMGLAE